DFLKERAEDPTLRRELAHVYFRVGDICLELGQRDAASASRAQARRLYESLAAEHPDDPDLLDGVARCLSRSAKTAEAIAIWEKIVRPDDPRYQTELGIAYNTVALSHHDPARITKGGKRDPAKALEFHLKALTVRERVIRLKPGDPVAL